jgi:hypothetical protein
MSSGAITEGAQDFSGAKTFQAGSATIPGHNTAGLINIQAAASGTGADTTEDTLYTYTLPANAFSVPGKAVRVRVWGTTGANANNKTVKVYFGATVFSSATSAANNVPWYFEMIVTKTGSNTQFALVTGSWNGALQAPQIFSPSETDTAGIVIKCTGTNGTASANDVAGKCFMVEFLN